MKYLTVLGRGIIIGFLVCACGGDNSSSGSQGTVETQCRQVMQAVCSRAYSECTQSKDNLDACVSSGTSACCQDRCSSNAGSLQSSIDQCVAEMHKIPCSSLADPATVGAAVPADCQGVVRAASANLGMDLESALSAALSRH